MAGAPIGSPTSAEMPFTGSETKLPQTYHGSPILKDMQNVSHFAFVFGKGLEFIFLRSLLTAAFLSYVC